MNNIQEQLKEVDWDEGFDIFSLFDKKKENVHPAEIAQVLDVIPYENALKAYLDLPKDTQISVFSYFDFLIQYKLIKSMPRHTASFVLNQLSSDDRTSFFTGLSDFERTKYLNYLNYSNKLETQDFLGFPEDSVARLIDTDFATVYESMSIEEAGEYLRRNFKDSVAVNVIYVIDENGKLIDDIQVRRLVLNEPRTSIKDLMDGDFVYLNVSDSIEKAIHKFKEYDRVVMPVTNEDMVLIGVVTVDDIMDAAEDIETEGMQKFGGVEKLDYPYVKTSFFRLTEKRATWLVILFIGEMLTATAMGYFEHEIAAAVVLALFVPLIISSGGNSGSQAATLIIRALALKEITLKDWWFVVRREFLSGLVLGIILGTIGFIRITIWQQMGWYDYGEHWLLIASTIFTSLIGIVLWGTLMGSLIPLILKRIKIDPATSSAPFVATLVDVTGLIIYFTIAAIILKGTLL